MNYATCAYTDYISTPIETTIVLINEYSWSILYIKNNVKYFYQILHKILYQMK